MPMRHIAPDATNQSVVVRFVDSTDGTPEEGVTSATGGLNLWYRREGAAVSNLTESDLSTLADAHSDGGMLHIDDGYYRVDVPDAAFATGVDGVMIGGTATGMVCIGCYVPLNVASGADIADNVLDEALSGHTTAGTAGKALSDIDTNVQNVETDTQDIQSRLPSALVAGKMDSDAVAISGSTTAADDVQANIGNLDAAVSAVETDTQDIQSRLPSALVGGRMDSDVSAISTSTTAADNLELSALQIQPGTVDGISFTSTTTQFQTDTAGFDATDDHYNGRIVIFTSGVLQYQATNITDYDGTNKRFTVTALTEAPGDNDNFIIL